MTDTPTLKDMAQELAQELAQAAATESCMTGYIDKDRLDLWITDALTDAYERGQRDASPPPGEDLVERVEFIIGDAKEALLSDEDLARAILAEIERKT